VLMLNRVCVFCGSSSGSNSIYSETAWSVGNLLAKAGIGLVFGGGRVGLMGSVAQGALDGGGEVIGVIPKSLFEVELAHGGLPKLCVVSSMHERKALMGELSDAFLTLPGGFGTFEEFFEVITWSQLGIHRKPTGVLNISGFFDPLLALCDHAVKEGFLSSADRSLILTENSAEELIQKLSTFVVPKPSKWMAPSET
jgi:uncharacterized protein (TIGR00730 family)